MATSDVSQGNEPKHRAGGSEELLDTVAGDDFFTHVMGRFVEDGDELVWKYRRSYFRLVPAAFIIFISSSAAPIAPVPERYYIIAAGIAIAAGFAALPFLWWTVRFRRPNRISIEWRWLGIRSKKRVVEPVKHIRIVSRGSTGEGFGRVKYFGLVLDHPEGTKRLPGSTDLGGTKRTQKRMLDWLNARD